MPVRPNTLQHIMDARGVSDQECAAAFGMSLNRLLATLDGQHMPTKRQVVNFGDKLAVPYFAIFSKTYQVPVSDIIDFRTSSPTPFKYGMNAKSIMKVIRRRNFFAELFRRLDLFPPEKIQGVEEDENPEQTARAVRYQLGLDEIQSNATNPKEFYDRFRSGVEGLGIFTIQDHNISRDIDGYALFDKNFVANTIFVSSSIRNTKRRSFTLAHELAHLIGKRSAISNDYESDNEVEKYCNEFAACLLMPREQFLEIVRQRDLSFHSYEAAVRSAEYLSDYFKTSLSSCLVRAYRLKVSEANYFHEFLSGFGDPEHPDTAKPSRGGGGGDQGPIVAAEIGQRAIALIAQAIESGVTSSQEVFENTGLNKKRIERLPSYASQRKLSLK